jgi:CheY-like chemotaxis protein
MALVLCTGVDKALLQSRQLILERAGHTVVSVTDEQTLTAVCQKHSFDVAVIGQAVSSNMKHRIASLVRQHCPDAKILELHPLYSEKVLAYADSWLSVPVDVPNDLADRVNELAGKGKHKRAKS